MDFQYPGSDLLGEDQAAVFMALARTTEPQSGRAIAQRAGRSDHSTTRRILARLSQSGIVRVGEVGRSTTYLLNREHVLWKPVFEMLAAPAVVEMAIAEVVREHDPAAVAATFGSFSRREAGRSSDIDIVVVTSETTDSATLHDALVERIQAMCGNEIQPIILNSDALRRLVAADDPLVQSWRADAHDLVGEFSTLLDPA